MAMVGHQMLHEAAPQRPLDSAEHPRRTYIKKAETTSLLPTSQGTGLAPRLRRRVHGLATATDGVALVEMAFIAPVLAVIALGLIDIAFYAADKIKAQQAVNRGLEMAMMAGPSVSAADIREQAALQAGVPLDEVTVSSMLECAGVETDWSATCGSGQETAREFQIDISTVFVPKFIFGTVAKTLMSTDGTIALEVSGVIRIQ